MALDECYVLDKAALGIQQTCDESALCVHQINVAKEIKHPEEFRSRCFFIVIHLLRIVCTMCKNDSIVSSTGYLYKKKKSIILYIFYQLDVLVSVSTMIIMRVLRYLILMQETNMVEAIR